MKVLVNLLLIGISGLMISCATVDQTQHQEETMPESRYEMAEKMLTWNLSPKIFRQDITAEWIDDTTFWYYVNGREGREFYLVDVEAVERHIVFDLSELIETLKENNGVEPDERSLTNVSFPDVSTFTFKYDGYTWECSTDLTCRQKGEAPERVSNAVRSPNDRYDAFIKEYNIWVMDYESGKKTQITTDGEYRYGYGTNNQGWFRSDTPVLHWSPDSRKIATFRLDERGVENMVLWKTQTGRPEADIWPYALPGDTIVPMMERVVLDIEEASVVALDTEPDHQRTSNCCGLTRGDQWADIQWNDDASKLAFTSTSRDYKTVTLRIADTQTGAVETMYSETAEPFFESNLTSRGEPNWRVLFNRNQFLWYTRKDNWGHLYLHDLSSGELINRVTSGDWNVVDMYHLDQESGEIWFTGVGREQGFDPYQEYVYKGNLDGRQPELLTAEEGHHEIWMHGETGFFVDTWSDFQTPQTTVLRNESGKILLTLEEADIQDIIETGWTAPQPFTTKGRDGETDIYGVMYLPSDFDPEKTYPILNNIYPGPQVGSIGTRGFSIFRRGQVQSLAELGFVVVQVDGFGTPMRSRDFHTYYYGDMSDNGLLDQIAAMKELAKRHSYIDINRAGIYGHSGGGFATAAALFQYPEFFTVGVSSAGNHDNRGYTYYWGEKFQGLLEEKEDGDTYTNQANQLQAGDLQGKLLISYGTMDTNVHPGMTLLVIDELIRHNKDFDVMVMPNRGHGYANEPYKVRRTWDYFVKYLMGVEPPEGYLIKR